MPSGIEMMLQSILQPVLQKALGSADLEGTLKNVMSEWKSLCARVERIERMLSHDAGIGPSVGPERFRGDVLKIAHDGSVIEGHD